MLELSEQPHLSLPGRQPLGIAPSFADWYLVAVL